MQCGKWRVRVSHVDEDCLLGPVTYHTIILFLSLRYCGGRFGVFTGSACETMKCVKNSKGDYCGGNGACMTMRELAAFAYDEDKQLRRVVYSDSWDAE